MHCEAWALSPLPAGFQGNNFTKRYITPELKCLNKIKLIYNHLRLKIKLVRQNLYSFCVMLPLPCLINYTGNISNITWWVSFGNLVIAKKLLSEIAKTSKGWAYHCNLFCNFVHGQWGVVQKEVLKKPRSLFWTWWHSILTFDTDQVHLHPHSNRFVSHVAFFSLFGYV